MEHILTYYELKASNTSKIFEAEDTKGLKQLEILEGEQFYNKLVDKLESGDEIEEGFFGAIAGGVAGALIGPAIGKAICKALGVEENGPLGKLLTSKLVSIAIGASLAK
jgi:uncharacterized membrane protein YeaQ/YmgE (transglycosylase-associated protein family)